MRHALAISRSARSLCLLALLCALAMPLSGCGLRPVYGVAAEHRHTAPFLQSIEIGNIPDRSGQSLRNHLIDRMHPRGAQANTLYILSLSPIQEAQIDLGIAKDATATRSQLRLGTTLTLTNTEGDIVLTRNLGAVASYNRLASQYTTRVTEQDARQQAISDLADQIITQLELYATRTP